MTEVKNSVMGIQCLGLNPSPASRSNFKGSFVFSYMWDKIAGHFPHVRSLANKNGMDIRGHSEDRDLADACRADMIQEQKAWFGESTSVVDINQILGKSVITTLELFTYFADNKIFPQESIIMSGGVFYPTDM